MATRKKKTRRKKASKKSMWQAAVKASKRAVLGKRTRRKRRARNPVLGTLGRKDSGTARSHKPLKVLEKRLSRLSKIVAARKKNPSKWK